MTCSVEVIMLIMYFISDIKLFVYKDQRNKVLQVKS